MSIPEHLMWLKCTVCNGLDGHPPKVTADEQSFFFEELGESLELIESLVEGFEGKLGNKFWESPLGKKTDKFLKKIKEKDD